MDIFDRATQISNLCRYVSCAGRALHLIVFALERLDKMNIFYGIIEEAICNIKMIASGGYLDNGNVWLFGPNSIMGMTLYYLLDNADVHICGILDNDEFKQGRSAFGYSVFAPDEVLSNFDDSVRVLIASAREMEMINQLKSMGYRLNKHIFVVVDLCLNGNSFHHVDRMGHARIGSQLMKSELVSMMKRMDDYANEFELRYFLAYGTLLGAVRHQGFIPWDDDVDLFVPFKEMQKWNDVFDQDKRYSLYCLFSRDVVFPNATAVLSDNSYTCEMNQIPQMTCGIPADVYPLIGLPDDSEECAEYLRSVREMEIRILMNYNDTEKRKVLINELINELLRYDFDSSRYVTPFGGIDLIKDVTEHSYFSSFLRMRFEDTELRVPNGYDYFLKSIYNDYMVLPPEEKRNGTHDHYVFLNDES